MVRIVVVGSANVDFVVRTPHIPRPGETVLGRDFVMAMGGKGANQAVAAARLGAQVTFVACVGQDVFGAQCLDTYQAEGMDTAYVTRNAEQATGVALIAVDEAGENSITVASGANMRLSPAQVEAAAPAFDDADALLMQLEIPEATILRAAQQARRTGVRVILNPAPARALPPELLPLIDVITPNRLEAAQLMGIPEGEVRRMTDEQLVKGVLGLGPSAVVITLGAEGALAGGSWGWVRVPAFRVTAVDTTAAGDAFNGGLAVALSRGDNLEQSARYAAACGAVAATRLGAQPSLPTAAEVERLMAGS